METKLLNLHRDRVFASFFCFLIWSAATATERAELQHGSAATALNQAEDDPSGNRDSFLTLSEASKKRWAIPQDVGLQAKRERIMDIETTVRVDLRLVGFDGDDNGHLNVKPEELRRLIDTFDFSPHLHVIHGKSHKVLPKVRHVFRVFKTSRVLSGKIQDSISEQIENASHHNEDEPFILLPASSIDSHIHVDARAAERTAGERGLYALYIINGRTRDREYAYVYGDNGASSAGKETKDSRRWARCAGSCMANNRYAWVDLAAGLVSFGPRTAGPGLVYPSSTLRVETYPPSTLHQALLPHLTSLLRSSVSHLFSPPLLHSPSPLSSATHVWLIHIRSAMSAETEKRGGEEEEDPEGVDLRAIEKEILSHSHNLLLPRQTLSFQTAHVYMSHCAACTNAYTRSMRTFLSTSSEGEEEGQEGGGARVGERHGQHSSTDTPPYVPPLPHGLASGRFLDSEELHHALSDLWPDIKTASGIPDPIFDLGDREPGEVPSSLPVTFPRLVPIFLFDLQTEELVLLDQKHQSISFDDMVMAVRTQAKPVPSDYMCQDDPVPLAPSEVTRPIMSALLQTVWGLAPTHVRWCPHSSSSAIDFRWSLSPSPFGPFPSSTSPSASSLSLPLFQRDAALRNLVLSQINTTMGDALHLLDSLAEYGPEDLLFPSSSPLRTNFTERWNLLVYKLEKSAASVSSLDFSTASFFVRSARHEIEALYRVARTAASELQTTFACFQEAPLSWTFHLFTLVSVAVILAVLASRGAMFRSKQKRF